MPRTMHRLTVSNVLLSSASALAAVSPAFAGTHLVKHLPVPEHSFLSYHTANLRELSQEVTLDPVVRARLAKHFHISEAKLVAYIRQNLVLIPLKQDGTYKIACVRPNGEEFWVKSYLNAGTPVFASRTTGRPILKLACGNPMVVSLPAPLTPNPLTPPQLAAAPALAELTPAAAPTLMAAAVPESALLDSSDLIQPPVVQVSPSLQFLGGSSGSSFLPALLGLGGAIAVFGHDGSDSDNSEVPAAPVPETSTFVSLGMLLFLGGGLMVVARRKHLAAPRWEFATQSMPLTAQTMPLTASPKMYQDSSPLSGSHNMSEIAGDAPRLARQNSAPRLARLNADAFTEVAGSAPRQARQNAARLN